MITTPGGKKLMTSLPLKLLPYWLSKIDAARVREELREKIERYQDACYQVLWEHFKAEIVPAGGATVILSGAELAVENARHPPPRRAAARARAALHHDRRLHARFREGRPPWLGLPPGQL